MEKYNSSIGYLKALGITMMVMIHACSDKMPCIPHFSSLVV